MLKACPWGLLTSITRSIYVTLGRLASVAMYKL